jgi:hypothetical protein
MYKIWTNINNRIYWLDWSKIINIFIFKKGDIYVYR